MEEKVFPDPAVAGTLGQFIEARLHNDGHVQDAVKKLQLRFAESLATPSYIILDPRTEEVIGKQLGPEMNPALFNKWLKAQLP